MEKKESKKDKSVAREKARAMMYLMKTNKTYVIFDRESTHYQPNLRYGKIIEISAVKVRKGEILETFDTLVDPEMTIPKKIVELTGITNKMCEGQPKWQEVVKKFMEFCEDCVVVGHNVGTDIKYIDFYAQSIGKRFTPHFVDTMYLAKYYRIEMQKDRVNKEFSLEKLAEFYNIKDNNHHRAMNDVIVTKELFYKLYKLMWAEIKKTSIKDFNIVEQEGLDLRPQTVELNKMEVTECNLWDKVIQKRNGSSQQYLRLYVKIYYNRRYGDVFYDFIDCKWGIKGELPFSLPDGYENAIMNQIATKKHISKEDCYKAASYRKN